MGSSSPARDRTQAPRIEGAVLPLDDQGGSCWCLYKTGTCGDRHRGGTPREGGSLLPEAREVPGASREAWSTAFPSAFRGSVACRHFALELLAS